MGCHSLHIRLFTVVGDNRLHSKMACKISQIPPDLVAKFQPINIVDVILWQIMQLRAGYVQKIKG
jgi:hypothetical protein